MINRKLGKINRSINTSKYSIKFRKNISFQYTDAVFHLDTTMSLFHITLHSPVWDIDAMATDTALVLLEFSDSQELEKKIKWIEKRYDTQIQEGKNDILIKAGQELVEYFTGKRKDFSIPLEVHGTEFQMKAWKALGKIPFGETRSYLEEATMIGNPKAVRAIGGANHNNPIIIIIPCHRVIGKSGDLVWYGWGIDRKIWLLEHEKKNY